MNVRNNNVKASRPKRLPVQEAKRSIYTPSLRLKILKGLPSLACVQTPHPPPFRKNRRRGLYTGYTQFSGTYPSKGAGGECYTNWVPLTCSYPSLISLPSRYHFATFQFCSQSLPRSKSFGGPESYGVTVTATAVKRNEGSSTLPPSKSPQRYNSSNLIQEKPVRASNADDVASRPVEMSWNSQVYAAPGDTVEVRLPRDVMGPKMTTSESTSSLDSVGTMDSSVSGSRRQGPAPPPRRSVSKLLSSFRTQGRREVPEQVQIPPKFGAVSRVSEVAANQPIHSASRSWPTEHVVESKASGGDVRQSWHAEPAISRREANSSTASDGPPERKLSKTSSMRYKSTVVITNMRSSSSSSVDENSGPTLYRSGQTSPEADKTQSDALQLKKNVSVADSAPVRAFGDAGGWMSRKPDSEAEKSRIEDTQILQRLLKDKANNVDRSLSVKSRVANFEGGLSRRISAGVPHRELLRAPQRSSSQGKIEVIPQPLKSTPVNQ